MLYGELDHYLLNENVGLKRFISFFLPKFHCTLQGFRKDSDLVTRLLRIAKVTGTPGKGTKIKNAADPNFQVT